MEELGVRQLCRILRIVSTKVASTLQCVHLSNNDGMVCAVLSSC